VMLRSTYGGGSRINPMSLPFMSVWDVPFVQPTLVSNLLVFFWPRRLPSFRNIFCTGRIAFFSAYDPILSWRIKAALLGRFPLF